MASSAIFEFENSFVRMPPRFYSRLAPTPVADARLIVLNETLVGDLGLDPVALRSENGVAALSGNRVPDGAEPLAMAYAGHQFGSWVPKLGDGRAVLLGEILDRAGRRRDIQLKGSGPTPFSRMGDGRAALGPVLREFIVSEAMAALGIATTRSLAVATTGEPVFRERSLPGAVLTRVAASHVRVGTFQYFAARRDTEALRLLADHLIDRLYPEIRVSNQPYRGLIDRVVARQAELIASWMLVGFIHGVMNTDNMSMAGETIDYGPCAFMDFYDPAMVYSSIDHAGRYAYGNQPHIAHWNLLCLAETLLPLLAEDRNEAIAQAQTAIDSFPGQYRAVYHAGLSAKIGLRRQKDGDAALAADLLDRMAANGADFTNTFRALSGLSREPADDTAARALFRDPAAFDDWALQWRARLVSENRSDAERQRAMRRVNPAFIPRNHLVEAALDAAVSDDDLNPALTLYAVLHRPFDDQPGQEFHARPPRPEEVVRATFCGT